MRQVTNTRTITEAIKNTCLRTLLVKAQKLLHLGFIQSYVGHIFLFRTMKQGSHNLFISIIFTSERRKGKF